jgi:peptide/nickel transport system substrate-binding protein
MVYYENMPYSWPDPCARNIEVNHEVAPWDDKEMRWALNYAINRNEIVAIAYEGATTASRFIFPAYAGLDRYVDLVEEAGLYEKYPMLKHDPEKAKAIIESKGYTFNKKSGYYEKDGKELAFHIQTPEPLIEKQKIAQVVVEQLQRIGINATFGNVAYGTFWDNFFNGNYDARTGWQTCGSINEPWASMDTLNASWYVPIGERASKNAWRWRNEEYSKIVDEIGILPLGDPKIDDLFVKAAEIFMDELPVIPVTQAKKIIPFNTTYWTNWPSADNAYIHPPTWWQNTHVIIHNLQPAK